MCLLLQLHHRFDQVLYIPQYYSKNYLRSVCFRIDDHNERKTALCYGLKTSSTPEDDYKTLLQHYADSKSAIERRAILTSLGCISNSAVLAK